MQTLWNEPFISGRKGLRSRMRLIRSAIMRLERRTRRTLGGRICHRTFQWFRKKSAFRGERGRQKERKRETEREREGDRKTGRETGRQKERKREIELRFQEFDESRAEVQYVGESHCANVHKARDSDRGCLCWDILCFEGFHAFTKA